MPSYDTHPLPNRLAGETSHMAADRAARAVMGQAGGAQLGAMLGLAQQVSPPQPALHLGNAYTCHEGTEVILEELAKRLGTIALTLDGSGHQGAPEEESVDASLVQAHVRIAKRLADLGRECHAATQRIESALGLAK